jgi:two-component system alkaline phosphatase synthesis response regulator PhoP
MSSRILVVDDERDIVTFLKYNLEKEGYGVFTAHNASEALSEAQKLPDLITLDILMPPTDGLELARQLKRNPVTASIPIIFISAKDSEIDEVVGFEIGAVDYIRKPVSIGSLLARIRSALRMHGADARAHAGNADVIQIEGLEINLPNYSVTSPDRKIILAKREFELLAYLAKNRGKVLSRRTLLNDVWGRGTKVYDRTVDVHIRKIREKLGSYANIISTVKGVGYRFMESGGTPGQWQHP